MSDRDENTGKDNSGHYNSGRYNSGNYNSGHYNSGHYNSGRYNSGNYNSGNYNGGHYNSGDFNTDEPNVRMFNKDTGKKRSEIAVIYLALPTTMWIHDTDMTSAEKAANPQFSVLGGYFKTISYKEAWAEAWPKLSKETQQQFLDLPNFDAKIFEEITGIDVTPKTVTKPDCSGKTVVIDGVTYQLVLKKD